MADNTPGPHVLVADDSPLLLQRLARAFSDAGFQVALAADGEEALRKLGAFEPSAVLVDLYLPGLGGGELCRLAKSHPRWRVAFFVLMGARLNEGELESYRRLGVGGFLQKPFDPREAVALVRGAVAR